jgi:ketosteroid isomerase-like protein
MYEQIIERLRQGYAAFSRGDVQGAVDVLDPDPGILWTEPASFHAGGTYHGRAGVLEYLTRSREPVERAESVPEEIVAVGDKLVVFVHFHAWPKGGGTPREGRIADVYTVQDGKIVQMHAYSDQDEARRAVGLPPR